MSLWNDRDRTFEFARLADRINPGRLAAAQFDTARRGYRREQVDQYKARAVAALEDSERRRADAELAVRSLQKRIQMLETRGMTAPVDNEAIRILATAQQQADGIMRRSEETARQTEFAAKQYYNDVVARAHRAAMSAAAGADTPPGSAGSAEASRAEAERERHISYLRTFLDVVRASRAELVAYEPVLEKMLDAAEIVMSGLQRVENDASSALEAAKRQAKTGQGGAHASSGEPWQQSA